MHSPFQKYKESQKPRKPLQELQYAKVNAFPSNQPVHLIALILSPIRIPQYQDSPQPKYIHILEKPPGAQPTNLPLSIIFGPTENLNTSSSYIAEVAHPPTWPIELGPSSANDPPTQKRDSQ